MTGCQRFSTSLSGQMQGQKLLAKNVLCVYSRPVVRIRPGGKLCCVNVRTPFSLLHNTTETSPGDCGGVITESAFIYGFPLRDTERLGVGHEGGFKANSFTKFGATYLKHTQTGHTRCFFIQ